MKTRNPRWLILAAFVVAATTFVAWKNAGPRAVQQYAADQDGKDTIPSRKKLPKKDYKTGDLDDAMRELDRAMSDLDKNISVDMRKVNEEVKAALEEVKKLDFDKIAADVNASLDNINWDDTHANVERALRQAKESLKKVDKDKIRASVDAAKNSIALSIDGNLIKNSVELGLQAAKMGIEKAKNELKLLHNFLSDLEKDGLIKKGERYRISIKDHEMYINGKKQSKEVNQKYNKYFKDGNYSINSDGDDDDDRNFID